MHFTTALTGISVLLLLFLFVVYVKNYRKMKSSFTLGLILFASLFIILNGVNFYYFITMMPYYVEAVGTHVFLLSLLQTLAFGVLVWLSWR